MNSIGSAVSGQWSVVSSGGGATIEGCGLRTTDRERI